MSYLLSRFLLNLVISALFFWILVSCSLSSFLSSMTLSSSSTCPAACFFFFLSRSFSTISSILVASSLSCPLSLMCCSMSFPFLRQSLSTRYSRPSVSQLKYNSSIAHPPTIYTLYINMSLLSLYSADLLKKPAKINQLTEEMLKQASKAHHPLNKLLPGTLVADLLQTISPDNLLRNNMAAAQFFLALNGLRTVVVSNFGEFSHNKLYSALTMNYALCLQKVTSSLKEESDHIGVKLRLVARGWMAHHVFLKLLQKSHTFLPEYYRFIKAATQVLSESLSLTQQNFSQEQFNKVSAVHEGSSTPIMMLRSPFKKEWKRELIIRLISQIGQQVIKNIKEIGYFKESKDLEIVHEIFESYDRIRSTLQENERSFCNQLSLQQSQKDQETMYLDEPIQVRELTPRFYDEEESMKIKKLKRKRDKLKKKMEVELRQSVQVKQQEGEAIEEVKREKRDRQRRKELLVVEKQTVEAKKMQKAMKKAKKIQKTTKGKK